MKGASPERYFFLENCLISFYNPNNTGTVLVARQACSSSVSRAANGVMREVSGKKHLSGLVSFIWEHWLDVFIFQGGISYTVRET